MSALEPFSFPDEGVPLALNSRFPVRTTSPCRSSYPRTLHSPVVPIETCTYPVARVSRRSGTDRSGVTVRPSHSTWLGALAARALRGPFNLVCNRVPTESFPPGEDEACRRETRAFYSAYEHRIYLEGAKTWLLNVNFLCSEATQNVMPVEN